MTTGGGETRHAEPLRRKIIPYLARYGLLISLASVGLTFSIVGACAEDSPPLPIPRTPPTTEEATINQCRQQYSALRRDVEAKAHPLRDVRGVPAITICSLLTTLGEAELTMISFVEANSSRCRISIEISEKIRSTHVATEKIKAEACKKPELRWRE
jgi:hypothetical protein